MMHIQPKHIAKERSLTDYPDSTKHPCRQAFHSPGDGTTSGNVSNHTPVRASGDAALVNAPAYASRWVYIHPKSRSPQTMHPLLHPTLHILAGTALELKHPLNVHGSEPGSVQGRVHGSAGISGGHAEGALAHLAVPSEAVLELMRLVLLVGRGLYIMCSGVCAEDMSDKIIIGIRF